MSKEFKIGLLALVASIFLYSGFHFLKGSDFFSTTKTYYVVYENVNGLTISNPVMLNGLSVGKVSNIEILQKQGNKLLVTLHVRDGLALGKNSKAMLTDNGLLGGKMIDLEIGKVGTPLKDKDTLNAVIKEGMMTELSEKADPFVAKADSIMSNVSDIVESLAKSKEDVSQMLDNFNGISGNIRSTLNQGQLNSILGNMNQLSASLVNMQQKFNPIVGKMDNFADKLNEMELAEAVKTANESLSNLNEVLGKVNQGEGTLGALANDDSLYQNLNGVTENLDKLFIDLRENPKRYVNISVFGKKEKDEKKK